mgnify:CR=1 FL=1
MTQIIALTGVDDEIGVKIDDLTSSQMNDSILWADPAKPDIRMHLAKGIAAGDGGVGLRAGASTGGFQWIESHICRSGIGAFVMGNLRGRGWLSSMPRVAVRRVEGVPSSQA